MYVVMPLEQGCRVHEPGGPPPTTTARELIERSPFVVIATCDADGRLDASPKGDPPGFVHVIDSTTLAIPEPTGLPRTPGLSCTSCAAAPADCVAAPANRTRSDQRANDLFHTALYRL